MSDEFLLGVTEALKGIEKRGLYRCPKCSHLMIGKPCDWNICSQCCAEFGYDQPHHYEALPLWEEKK